MTQTTRRRNIAVVALPIKIAGNIAFSSKGTSCVWQADKDFSTFVFSKSLSLTNSGF